MKPIKNMDSKTIQAELNRLSESKPSENQTKAALFNLVVYTHECRRTENFKKMVDTILQQFPCRLIFIQVDTEDQQPLINVQVKLSTTDKDSVDSGASSDQIFIQASGSEIERISFLILPHLIPDLPIYLLWSQDPTADTIILPRLQPLATRIIFDSESTHCLFNFAEKILDLMQNSTLEIVDMNWMRIAGWRQIMTRAFETQTRAELLSQTSFIKLIYNSSQELTSAKPETQALYLQAWLASCLNWKFEKLEVTDKNSFTLHYKGPSHAVEIYLKPETRKDLDAGEIIEWELGNPDNYDCIFSRRTMNQVRVKASNRYQCLLPFDFLLPTLHSGRSLMQEIFYQKISPQYSALLTLISQLKGKK